MMLRLYVPGSLFGRDLRPGSTVRVAEGTPLTWEGRTVGTIRAGEHVVDARGGITVTAVDVDPALVPPDFPYPFEPVVGEVSVPDALEALLDGPTPTERLASLLERAPVDLPGMPPGRFVVFSARCCWWTFDVRDSVHGSRFGGPPLPLCPSCGSHLYQRDAERFVADTLEAIDRPRWGNSPASIEQFLAAYNRTPCHREWRAYTTPEV